MAMKYGFIYAIIDTIMSSLRFLNVVELFKLIARRLAPQNDAEAARYYQSIAIDIFIVVKWAFILCCWLLDLRGFATIITCYLLFTNVYTYFLNHVWDENPYNQTLTLERSRRRFVSLFLALAFSDLGYAYLYHVSFQSHYKWPEHILRFVAAVQFSITNSLGGSYNNVEPITSVGSILASTQQVITLVFIAVILAKSLPQSMTKIHHDGTNSPQT